MRKIIAFCIIFTMLAFLSACRKTPAGILDNQKMASLLADIHKGEGVIEVNRKEFRSDSSKIDLLNAIYERHNVTKQDFDTSLDWYGHNMEEYMKVYDEVIEILQNDLDNISSAYNVQVAAIGDSVNTWTIADRYILSGNIPDNKLAISLNADENWEPGDNYTVNFKIINSLSPVKAMVGVEYEDGALEWIEHFASDNGKYSYTVVSDSTKTLDNVYCIISAELRNKEILFLDSISLMRTRINKMNYPRRFSQKKLMHHSATLTNENRNIDTVNVNKNHVPGRKNRNLRKSDNAS